LFGELEHLQIKTRSIDEKFASVMGEWVKTVKRKPHDGSGSGTSYIQNKEVVYYET
jgi:hypothetical protein